MEDERKTQIQEIFPNLSIAGEYEATSLETDAYNCIAWALYDTQHWWWPTQQFGSFWLPQVPRNNSIAALVMIFQMNGYKVCESSDLEPGFEKVALYQIDPESGVEHASRQLQNGEWTSKLGEWEDIRHKSAQSVECEDYGKVAQVLKRRRLEWD